MSKIPIRRWKLWCVVIALSAGCLVLSRREQPDKTEVGPALGAGLNSSAGQPVNPGRLGEPVPATEQMPSRALFTFVEPANAAALTAALPAPTREMHYVRLDPALVTGKRSPFWQKPGAGRVELPLPDGSSLTVAIDRSEMLGPDRFTSVGQIDGRPLSRALFAWNEGFLHASIEDPQLGNFALRAATGEVYQFYKIDPALVPPCGGERLPPRAAAGRGTGVPPVDMGETPMPPPTAALENPQAAEVHVLMAYTQAVLSTMTGAARTAALQSAFDLAIAKTNAAFEASLVTARVKLVRIVETQYDEDVSTFNKVQDDALTALHATNDGKMDELHAIRDAAGADIVCLALGRPNSASIGLSFLINQPGQYAHFAFSVVQYSVVAGTNVVPHELGHVFGCAHDRENALSGQGAYSYSYGYRFRGADGQLYHDIMSYPPGIELGYFSNPNLVLPAPISVPIGIAAGRPGEANSALTIEKTAFTTSTYRLQTGAPANAGTLVNVATRAFVGTGDQVLIGGFVVNGSQPKSLLIRAAGPALGAFGVGDALADPVLRVFAQGSLVAENDNWSLPIGAGRAAAAGEIAAAANAVRAFPFAAGSADAAVLVSLAPGAYSAVVEGARGATGSGMIEAYEVVRDGSRLVNLATRGFASREREMYGGFVVQGAPGTTKRILIRVLGPTLSRAPYNFTDALDDPEMELRNAAGEILLANDDWSSGVQGGGNANAENDFQPLVETYAETRIFATGYAPANRREPCVMADLPPGNYTIVVRPFELRSANPIAEQLQAPGVGVMEVYEINQ